MSTIKGFATLAKGGIHAGKSFVERTVGNWIGRGDVRATDGASQTHEMLFR